MEYLGMFAIAFFVEICATLYTVCIARERYNQAVILSIFLTILNTGIIFFALDNRLLLAPSALGEILGTVTGLRWSKRNA